MKRLVLFDIDGTLIRPDSRLTRMHIDSCAAAFRKVFGISASVTEIEYAGKTDRRNIREVLTLKGMDSSAIESNMGRVIQAMAEYIKGNIGTADVGNDLTSGAMECIDMLAGDNGYLMGLVTGNSREIARLKLEKLGIWHHFKVGGFGDMSEVRADLVREAMRQAEQSGIHAGKRDVYVVGDTRFDIQCARESGVVSVAVATGKYSEEELRRYGPDYVIKDLLELPGLLK